jgi:hypothetical protein
MSLLPYNLISGSTDFDGLRRRTFYDTRHTFSPIYEGTLPNRRNDDKVPSRDRR